MYRREFIRLLVGAAAGIFAEKVVAEEILSEEDTTAEVLGSMRIQYVTPASNHKCEICGRSAQHHLHDMREVKSEGEYRVWEHVGPAHSYCDEHISESDPRDGLVKAWT